MSAAWAILGTFGLAALCSAVAVGLVLLVANRQKSQRERRHEQ